MKKNTKYFFSEFTVMSNVNILWIWSFGFFLKYVKSSQNKSYNRKLCQLSQPQTAWQSQECHRILVNMLMIKAIIGILTSLTVKSCRMRECLSICMQCSEGRIKLLLEILGGEIQLGAPAQILIFLKYIELISFSTHMVLNLMIAGSLFTILY